MRIALATLLLACISLPSHAEDRYSGHYSAGCGQLVCELDIRPAGKGWSVRWTASDPTRLDAVPVCSFKTTAELGSAAMGPAGVVSGIAVGQVRGRPFGLFDLAPGRVSWSSSWQACEGVAPKAIYEAFGDE
ncbi:hypothetical protein [Aureimonas glaciei]|uniref:Uncharacterized protein n=1 Tax=Aureimonas glaciei TaxID=1776957 RepID=A0A917DDI5_9HYPH|nr:hypothetical protein [Aureimonas glaciei]GGD28903.1 hypothetical protein GCM10011335_35100 [Aureimonas glaciei]